MRILLAGHDVLFDETAVMNSGAVPCMTDRHMNQSFLLWPQGSEICHRTEQVTSLLTKFVLGLGHSQAVVNDMIEHS